MASKDDLLLNFMAPKPLLLNFMAPAVSDNWVRITASSMELFFETLSFKQIETIIFFTAALLESHTFQTNNCQKEWKFETVDTDVACISTVHFLSQICFLHWSCTELHLCERTTILSGPPPSFLGDLRSLVRFVSFWKKRNWIKWNPYAGSSISMCTPVSWSKWGLIWDVLGSFGLFWVGDNAQGRNLWSLNFCVHEVRKFKFGSAENVGCGCRNGSISLKAQIFCKGSILMNCSILYGGLRGSIWFLIFKNFCGF